MGQFTTRRRRAGISSVLAMLFLMLFTALALGFYAATTVSVQVSKNERDVTRAQAAAESGLQFLRYQLAKLTIPPGTADSQIPAEIEADLEDLLEGTGNLGQGTITRSGNTITIPSISLSSDSSFAATLLWNSGVATLNVTGSAGSGAQASSRGVQIDFNVKSSSSSVFNFGVAAKGPITVKNSTQTKVLGTPDLAGSMLSAYTGTTAITTGNGTIDGDLSVVVAETQVDLGGGSVGGASNSTVIMNDHVHVVASPEFPVVDTTKFKPFAVNTYVNGAGYQKNIRVPPNTNPRFNGGDVVEGILYIESPNSVTFRGHATINGIIVFEGIGSATVNSLDFRGNVSPQSIPNTAEFAAIKAAANGLAIVAPTASVTMSGSTDGTLAGSMIAYKVSLAGSADLHFTNGSIISLGPDAAKIEGKTVNFNGNGANNPPTFGLSFSGSLRPDPLTYLELQQ